MVNGNHQGEVRIGTQQGLAQEGGTPFGDGLQMQISIAAFTRKPAHAEPVLPAKAAQSGFQLPIDPCPPAAQDRLFAPRVQVAFPECSSSRVTATAAFADRRTFCPSTSATSPKSIK
jgi:hypothetical protein